jgi:hypothetical protein
MRFHAHGAPMTGAKKLEGLCSPGCVLASPAVAAACLRAAAPAAAQRQPSPLAGRRPPSLSGVLVFPGGDAEGDRQWVRLGLGCTNSNHSSYSDAFGSPGNGSPTAAARGGGRFAGLIGLLGAGLGRGSADLGRSPVGGGEAALRPAAALCAGSTDGGAEGGAPCGRDDADGPPVGEDDGPPVHVAVPGTPVLFGRA